MPRVKTSFTNGMSAEEAEAYLKFLENGSKSGLTPEELAGVEKVQKQLALNKVDYNDIYKMRMESNNIYRNIIKTQKNIPCPKITPGSATERKILNSFSGGKAEQEIFGEGITMYRIGGKNGPFWSLDPPPATEYEWRVNTAIKQEFCNNASKLYKFTIPKGSTVTGLNGRVGQQGMGLYGGPSQV